MIKYTLWRKLNNKGEAIESYALHREIWEKHPHTGKMALHSSIAFRGPSISRVFEMKDDWLTRERERLSRRETAKLNRLEGAAEKNAELLQAALGSNKEAQP